MSAERTFEVMRGVVEAPGYGYLKHYRKDFYEFDRDHLARTYSAEARYLWIVRECGTHLIILGVHPKMVEEALAVFALSPHVDIYLVEHCTVKRVSLEEAKNLVRVFRYRIDQHIVSGPRGRLASCRLEISPWSQGHRRGVVHYSSSSSPTLLNKADVIALVQIAECEVIKATQSLFTPTDLVWFDGEDLRAKLIALQNEHPGSPAACASSVALCN